MELYRGRDGGVIPRPGDGRENIRRERRPSALCVFLDGRVRVELQDRRRHLLVPRDQRRRGSLCRFVGQKILCIHLDGRLSVELCPSRRWSGGLLGILPRDKRDG